MKIALIILISLFFTGCLYVNERGIDTRYYNDCKEYYDSMGGYHKVCDENLLEFQDVKDGANKVIDTTNQIINTPQ